MVSDCWVTSLLAGMVKLRGCGRLSIGCVDRLIVGIRESAAAIHLLARFS